MKSKFSKISFVDDTGAEHPIIESRRRAGFVVFVVVISLVMGIFGGVIGMAIATGAPEKVQKWLGISQLKNAVSEAVRTEKVVVQEDSATIDVVKEVSPAVVNVTFTKNVSVYDPFNIYNQGQTVEQQGGGTGFIITSDGLIVTNKHVVSEDGAKYTAVANDGKIYDAKIVATDPTLDIALVKIEVRGLPVVKLGDSDNLQVGEKVIAIGNALGEFQNSVTSGVLSATGRTLTASDANGSQSESLDGLLQTDAAINLGNSGGPLVNLKGQVIGINTVTASKGQAEGLGFAIPINYAKSAIDSYKKSGKIIRAYLGVNTIEVTKEIADQNNLTMREGYLVAGDSTQGIRAVVSGSPADKAGIREGDILTSINKDRLNRKNSLISTIRKYSPGDEVTIGLRRGDKDMTITVKLGERT